jgi:rhodanese-related sulfurtransferase
VFLGRLNQMRNVQREDVERLIDEGAQLVEVLGQEEFDGDHLPGAVNIPLREIEAKGATTLDKTRPVVVYCWDSA